MHQFAILVISLSVAAIICSFSLMNGFNYQIVGKIIEKHGHINIYPKVPIEGEDMVLASYYNTGFPYFTIENKHIEFIEWERKTITTAVINKEQNKVIVMVVENPEQTTPLVISKGFAKLIRSNKPISIVDPNSYNAMVGTLTRQKVYKKYEINSDEHDPVAFISSKDYQTLFRNTKYNSIKITLSDDDYTEQVVNDITKTYLNPEMDIKSWLNHNPELQGALDIQKKIFYFLYTLLFTLLCAIIVSTNIAFFKEKRRDWALYKILNVFPYSVERIFLYKNIISCLITLFMGFGLGMLLTVYSNEILYLVFNLNDQSIAPRYLFGERKLTYVFLAKDFIKIGAFTFSIFIINLVTLLFVFRKETVSSFLKAGT